MKRLVIFAKGNLDLRDSLHALTIDGQRLWNGLNEAVRARFPGVSVRVRHETWTRSDALLAAEGGPPPELTKRALPLGAHGIAAQFSSALFDTPADAYVMSVQPDINTAMVRTTAGGALFHPYDFEHWPPQDRAWLRGSCVPVAPLTVEQSIANLERIVALIRARRDAPILIYNLSPVVPGEWVHAYDGVDETLGTRIRRFNLALVGLSRRTGVSIVDVDTLVARAGADHVKIDTVHLNAEGCRIVAEEVVRILDDHGLIEGEIARCA